jgi:hypothetical protein
MNFQMRKKTVNFRETFSNRASFDIEFSAGISVAGIVAAQFWMSKIPKKVPKCEKR